MNMTPEQIDALPAGRELDALALVHVCGWKWWQYKQANHKCWLSPPGLYVEDEQFGPVAGWPNESQRFSDWTSNRSTEAPHVSTDIAAAWTVVEAMKAKGWLMHLLQMHDGWVVYCRPGNEVLPWEQAGCESYELPLGICRAALKAVFAPKAQEEPCKT